MIGAGTRSRALRITTQVLVISARVTLALMILAALASIPAIRQFLTKFSDAPLVLLTWYLTVLLGITSMLSLWLAGILHALLDRHLEARLRLTRVAFLCVGTPLLAGLYYLVLVRPRHREPHL